MTETVTSGTLGPRAVQELRAVAHLRQQLAEQMEALGRKEAMILATIAEAQGCVAAPDARYDYDPDAGTWRVL